MEKSLTKDQPAKSSNTLGHEMSPLGLGAGVIGGFGVHLNNGQPAQGSTKLGYKMSTQGAGAEEAQGGVVGDIWL